MTSSDLSIEFLKKSANEKLENDICVKEMAATAQRFHARYNAIGKKYLYRIWNNEDINVFERKYSYHIMKTLDIEKVKAAAKCFIGTYDFRGFSSDKRAKKSTVKTIYSIEISNNNGMIDILFHGNSFLYNMVRIMTGTLIEIGLGHIPVSAVNDVLEHKDRSRAGFTAPPQGLFLKEVLY